jgi:hypothetical protein
MVRGQYPTSAEEADPSIEPLAYWLPRMVGPMPPLPAAQRRQICEHIILKQDDAWTALVHASL